MLWEASGEDGKAHGKEEARRARNGVGPFNSDFDRVVSSGTRIFYVQVRKFSSGG
jgi:hypothetical protein